MALAHLRHDIDLGIVENRSNKKSQPPAGTAARKKLEVGTYLGHLLRPLPAGIPTVACALLSQQEAAEAAARGMGSRIRPRSCVACACHMRTPEPAYAHLGGARAPSIVP